MLSKRDNYNLKKRRVRTNLKINLNMHHTQVPFGLKNTKQSKYAVEVDELGWCNYMMFYRRRCVFYRVWLSSKTFINAAFLTHAKNFDPRYPRKIFMDSCYPRYPCQNLTHATHAPRNPRHPRYLADSLWRPLIVIILSNTLVSTGMLQSLYEIEKWENAEKNKKQTKKAKTKTDRFCQN